ncbi:Uncharacterised protein [Plesiomonas shigelloides]|jgi:hypothetical protein|nr:Uncharacterised protein [Plesiomonas shigelloides]SPZ44571.1 Uncharacterised protein [Plesiomonas shigelloides]SUB63759.1 Uncharacterised protein [Plesiomonas shigelloides]
MSHEQKKKPQKTLQERRAEKREKRHPHEEHSDAAK